MPKYYPLAEGEAKHARGATVERIPRVQLTGEIRPPRKGEWYLSGAIPEGYMAVNDLETSYSICTLVWGTLSWVRIP